MGVLLNNQWSVGGNPLLPSVNTFLAQPFINYNMAHGWYLTSSPLITANWLAAPGQQWHKADISVVISDVRFRG